MHLVPISLFQGTYYVLCSKLILFMLIGQVMSVSDVTDLCVRGTAAHSA